MGWGEGSCHHRIKGRLTVLRAPIKQVRPLVAEPKPPAPAGNLSPACEERPISVLRAGSTVVPGCGPACSPEPSGRDSSLTGAGVG